MNLMVEILKTSNILELIINAVLKEFQLSQSQYNILRILNGAHPLPVSPGDLKQQMIFQTSDITRFIDRLVIKKFVERTTCPENRRKVDITITDEGKEILQAASVQLNKAMKDGYLDAIDSTQANEGIVLLKAIRAAAKNSNVTINE